MSLFYFTLVMKCIAMHNLIAFITILSYTTLECNNINTSILKFISYPQIDASSTYKYNLPRESCAPSVNSKTGSQTGEDRSKRNVCLIYSVLQYSCDSSINVIITNIYELKYSHSQKKKSLILLINSQKISNITSTQKKIKLDIHMAILANNW